jgi:hypothetical protein
MPPNPFIFHPDFHGQNTPLSQIRGFPDATSPGHVPVSAGEIMRQPSPLLMPQPFQAPETLAMSGGDGFNGPESLALPQVRRIGLDGGRILQGWLG